jgi:hypothetical protein
MNNQKNSLVLLTLIAIPVSASALTKPQWLTDGMELTKQYATQYKKQVVAGACLIGAAAVTAGIVWAKKGKKQNAITPAANVTQPAAATPAQQQEQSDEITVHVKKNQPELNQVFEALRKIGVEKTK